MYIFAEIKDTRLLKDLQECLNKDYMYSASDISPIEGFVFDNTLLEDFKKNIADWKFKKQIKLREIPDEFQNDIREFLTLYWDGDWSFEYGDLRDM